MKRSGACHSVPGIAMGFALLASGCSLVPAYQPPELAIPAAWSTADSNLSQQAEPVHGAWWRSFGSTEIRRSQRLCCIDAAGYSTRGIGAEGLLQYRVFEGSDW